MKKTLKLTNLLAILVLAIAMILTATACGAKTQSIQVDVSAAKVVYTVGEEFDSSGIKVTATLSDGTTKEVSLADCSFSGFNSSETTESQKITVTYDGFFAEYTVKINPDNPYIGKTFYGTNSGDMGFGSMVFLLRLEIVDETHAVYSSILYAFGAGSPAETYQGWIDSFTTDDDGNPNFEMGAIVNCTYSINVEDGEKIVALEIPQDDDGNPDCEYMSLPTALAIYAAPVEYKLTVADNGQHTLVNAYAE